MSSVPTKACIIVQLRSEIFDPQAAAIQKSLHAIGFTEVSNVRMQKVVELTLQNTDPTQVDSILNKMAELLLTNPVLEEYRIEVK